MKKKTLTALSLIFVSLCAHFAGNHDHASHRNDMITSPIDDTKIPAFDKKAGILAMVAAVHPDFDYIWRNLT